MAETILKTTRCGVMSRSKEFAELHDLNVELLETLLLAGQQVFDFANKHQIRLDSVSRLAALLTRAKSLLQDIAQPYHENPIISKAILQGKGSEKRPPDKLPVYPWGGCMPLILVSKVRG